MLTFLGGPRACIGWRFSLIEYVAYRSWRDDFLTFPHHRTKALIFTLVRAFEFEFAVPVEDIGKKTGLVMRPILKSDSKAGNTLPLRIRPVSPQ